MREVKKNGMLIWFAVVTAVAALLAVIFLIVKLCKKNECRCGDGECCCGNCDDYDDDEDKDDNAPVSEDENGCVITGDRDFVKGE
ncbi:MAG: hypothetical protein LBR83_05850 [Clostridiales bacterium]|jgi:hypothetical protein|nr:hypothetical protein [Clostridiales bacterium]